MVIRSPQLWAIAVRRPDGVIHTESHRVDAFIDRHPWLRRTILRGVLALADAVHVGSRGLRVAIRVGTGAEPTGSQIAATLSALATTVMLVFVAGPGVAVGLAGFHGAIAAAVEGGVRLAMFVVYLGLVSRSASAARLLGYHGAEHMTIAAFERTGTQPSRDDVRASSPIHSRCGTNFLTLSVLLCAVVFSVLPRRPVLAGAIWRVLLVPLVAALAYEVMRSAARAHGGVWSRVVTWPGRAAQRLTTKQPSSDQIEVALAALHELLSAQAD